MTGAAGNDESRHLWAIFHKGHHLVDVTKSVLIKSAARTNLDRGIGPSYAVGHCEYHLRFWTPKQNRDTSAWMDGEIRPRDMLFRSEARH